MPIKRIGLRGEIEKKDRIVFKAPEKKGEEKIEMVKKEAPGRAIKRQVKRLAH